MAAAVRCWPRLAAGRRLPRRKSRSRPEEQLQEGDAYTPSGVGGFLSGLARTNFLLGNMGGVRPFLAQYGISLALQETSEVLGNVSGGVAPGFRL